MKSAHDISRTLNPDARTSYSFGMDSEKLVSELRALADRIENKEVTVQSAIVYSRADIEDFTMSAFVLKYGEKVATPKSAIKELYGPDSRFPVAITRNMP